MINQKGYTGVTGQGFPPYVSLTELENGDVRVTVRGDPVHVEATAELPAHIRAGETVSAVVPKDEWKRLVH